MISDFFEDPQKIVGTVVPLRFRGNELVLFHVLDPGEIEPTLGQAALLVDMETDDAIETSPEYARVEYRQKMQAHLKTIQAKAREAGIDYFLLRTDRPLDEGLREYLTIRQGRM